jgi:acyl-CoA-binding protein
MSSSSSDELESKFQAAAENARHINGVSNEDKKKLYAHYKQATEGNINSERPGIFDLVGRAKWESWSAIRDMPKHEAKQKYIDLVESLQ